ncbi:MAG: hypothetical protein AB7I41_05300, partial [Candidatus Sericytochromatia bacterium]
MQRKHLFSSLMALSLLLTIGCGEKQPPPTTTNPGNLSSGLTPITPVDGDGGLTPVEDPNATPTDGSSNFNPNDNFDPNAPAVTPGEPVASVPPTDPNAPTHDPTATSADPNATPDPTATSADPNA